MVHGWHARLQRRWFDAQPLRCRGGIDALADAQVGSGIYQPDPVGNPESSRQGERGCVEDSGGPDSSFLRSDAAHLCDPSARDPQEVEQKTRFELQRRATRVERRRLEGQGGDRFAGRGPHQQHTFVSTRRSSLAWCFEPDSRQVDGVDQAARLLELTALDDVAEKLLNRRTGQPVGCEVLVCHLNNCAKAAQTASAQRKKRGVRMEARLQQRFSALYQVLFRLTQHRLRREHRVTMTPESAMGLVWIELDKLPAAIDTVTTHVKRNVHRMLTNILIGRRRADTAARRGGPNQRSEPLDDRIAGEFFAPDELMGVKAALAKLEQAEAASKALGRVTASDVLRLRLLGHPEPEVAGILGNSRADVTRKMRFARAFVARELALEVPAP